MTVKQAKQFLNKLDESWDNVKLIVDDPSYEHRNSPERFKELYLMLMNMNRRQADLVADEGSRILGGF